MHLIEASSGSFYKVGIEVGEACAKDIPEVYERGMEYLLKHTMVGHGMRIEKRKAFIHNRAQFYMGKGEALWRPSGQFLRGQAKGAGVDKSIIAVTSFTEEVSSEAGLVPPDKCSTLVIRLANGHYLLIHNEDFEAHNFGKMYILRAKFDGYPETVGMSYTGQLFNLAGSLTVRWRKVGRKQAVLIATTNNGMHPLAQPGWPKQVVHTRASLAGSIPEARNWLTRQPVSVTTHYFLVCGVTDEAVSLIVSNLETSNMDMELHQIIDRACFANNLPLDAQLKFKQPDPAIKNSPHSFDREKKLRNLRQDELPRTVEEALKLFSTRSKNVLFRRPGKEGASVTLATIVICPATGEMWIRDANPSATQLDWHFQL